MDRQALRAAETRFDSPSPHHFETLDLRKARIMLRNPLILVSFFSLLAGGCGIPSFLVTPVENSSKLEEQEVQSGKGFLPDKVAIIELEGLLSNSKGGGLLQPTENKMSLFAQQLERAEKDPSVKAVVLRVNSPGGTVTCSDAMYQLVRKFRAKTGKPVVASIQEVGASGAYYISCGADKIVAQPTSVVGSVGVIFESFEFSGTLAKLGVRSDDVKSGTLKDMGSPFKPLEPDEREVMQSMVEEYFARFIGVVRSNRPVTEPPATDLGDYRKKGYAGIYSGRVFSGDKAAELGLVDRTGLLEDAIDLAREMAKVPNSAAVIYVRPYGYGGSIYAETSVPAPQANVSHIELPGANSVLNAGFYYIWRPGL